MSAAPIDRLLQRYAAWRSPAQQVQAPVDAPVAPRQRSPQDCDCWCVVDGLVSACECGTHVGMAWRDAHAGV